MFEQIKNNFSIAYEQPLAFLKGSGYQAMCNGVKSVATFVVKGTVHTARGLHDISCDVANVIVNLLKSTDEQDNTYEHTDCTINPNPQNSSQETVDESSLAQLIAFISEISSEKDNTYWGSLANNSQDAPGAKIVMDTISSTQCIGQELVTAIRNMPKGVINSGLKSAYLSGVPALMNYKTTYVENDFNDALFDESFALIDLGYGDEEIEMVALGDTAHAE